MFVDRILLGQENRVLEEVVKGQLQHPLVTRRTWVWSDEALGKLCAQGSFVDLHQSAHLFGMDVDDKGCSANSNIWQYALACSVPTTQELAPVFTQAPRKMGAWSEASSAENSGVDAAKKLLF